MSALPAICLLLLLTGCASQQEPAQRVISDIDSSVRSASVEAARYVPDELLDVQGRLDALKAAFKQQDYAAVLAQGPAVLSAAQGLAGAAAARKQARLMVLNGQWTRLAAVLPEDVTAIQNRIDLWSRRSGKRSLPQPATEVDLDAARAGLSSAASLWSKSQAAFATGNMDEAVTTARSLEARLEQLAATLQLELPDGGAPQG